MSQTLPILSRIGSAVSRLFTRTADWQRPEGWTIVRSGNPGEFERKGMTARVEGWEANAVVNACVRAVADLYASVPLQAVRVDAEGNGTPLPVTHPAQQLLARPGVNMSLFRLQGLLATHYLLYGNHVWMLRRRGTGGAPVGVKLIHPEWIRHVYLDQDDEPVRWAVMDRNGRAYDVAYTEIVHFADLNADDWLFGYPRAAAALMDIIIDREASNYVREVVTNDGAATMIFTTHPDVSMREVEGMEERWREKRTARGLRGAAAFMPGTMDAKQIGWNLSQLEFPDLRRVSREDICAVFGVDPRMVGIGSATKDGGLSGVQYREARRRLLLQAVAPLMANVEAQLNMWLAPEYGTNVRFRHDPEMFAEISEDMTETSTRVLKELEAGARTLEETREAIGLPPERDPSHTVIVPTGRMEVLAGIVTLTEMPEPVAPEPSTPDAAEDEPEEQERALPAPPATTLGTDNGTVVGFDVRDTRDDPEADKKLRVWTRNDEAARRAEPVFVAAARLQFDVDARRVQDILLAGARAEPDAVPDDVWERIIRELEAWFRDESPRLWAERFVGPIRALGIEAGRTLAADLGLAWNIDAPDIVAAWEARAESMARAITQTTAENVIQLVKAGQVDGMGIRGVARTINQVVFEGAAPRRALTIAQTETMGAVNGGQYAMALQNADLIDVKEWLNLGDEKVRDSHVAMGNLTPIPLRAEFPNGLLYPGQADGRAEEVINCRCSLIYKTLDEDN